MGSRMLALNWVTSGSTRGRCSETIHLLSGLMKGIQILMGPGMYYISSLFGVTSPL